MTDHFPCFVQAFRIKKASTLGKNMNKNYILEL